MGAFGSMLQRHFGGTIHDVSTWDSKVNLPEEKFDDEYKIYRKPLNRLKLKIKKGITDINNVDEIKFKEHYRVRRVSEKNIDLLWESFLKFKNKRK